MPKGIINLSLNGWPPVASHFVALLTGVSLANLSQQDTQPSFSPHPKGSETMIQISIPKKRLNLSKEVNFQKKQSYFLINPRDQCLMASAPFFASMIGGDVILQIQKKEQLSAQNIQEIAYSKAKLQLEIKSPPLAICLDRSGIVYDE